MLNWRCRLQRTFFGLSDKYIQNVYEQFFLLKYHGGWSFIEAYNLPVKIRSWFVNRLTKGIPSRPGTALVRPWWHPRDWRDVGAAGRDQAARGSIGAPRFRPSCDPSGGEPPSEGH